jgi:heme/copper-type cytochrome/quinol oxidase subunit 3
MAIFLATEAALFGSLIGSYFYLRFTSPQWPQGGIAAPSVALPLVLTAVLVASTIPMAAAAAAARRGRSQSAWLLVALATLLQAGYLAVQIVQYIHDVGTFAPDTNAYSSIYFTLLGAHHAHVAVGLLLDAWLLGRLLGGLTHYRVVAVARDRAVLVRRQRDRGRRRRDAGVAVMRLRPDALGADVDRPVRGALRLGGPACDRHRAAVRPLP